MSYDRKTPRKLCGGTLLTILLHYKRQAVKSEVQVLGKKTNLRQVDFIRDLLRIMRPNHSPYNDGTFAYQSSRYKNCKINGGSDIPFHDGHYVSSYTRRVNEEFFRVAQEMTDLLSAYLKIDMDEEKRSIAKALLGAMAADSTILDSVQFYALPDGDLITKTDLINSENVCISSLVIGMLLYVAGSVPENKEGSDTLDEWYQHGLDNALAEVSLLITQPLRVQLGISRIAEENEYDGCPDLYRKYIERFMPYLKVLHDEHYRVPSFFQMEAVEFESFYVCPNLTKTSISGEVHRHIQNPTPGKLYAYSRLVSVYGMGGLGKSLLSKYLLLKAIRDFPKSGILPFFVELRKYKGCYDSLDDYLYNCNEELWDHTPRTLSLHLERNRTIVILDGMDELADEYYMDFEKNLELFINRYKKAQVIVTSRKIESRVLRQFSALDLALLTLDQAKELIKKVGYQKETDPELCRNFLEQLDSLYADYNQYIGNALLLSIMLLTFRETGGIPTGKIYRFFDEAFNALSYRHDSVHKSGFKRMFDTGLTQHQLKKVIAEFCASAYSDWNFSFTEEHASFYLDDMNAYKGEEKIHPVDTHGFIRDLKSGLCLLYEEGFGRYSFYHRSFQEYFAAYHVFNQEPAYLYAESELFEKGYNRDGESAFSMFYEMSPGKISSHVFLPLLRDLFDECETSDGCLTYLTTRYDVISYQTGTVPVAISNITNSLRLSFIISLLGCHEELIDADVPDPYGDCPEDVYYEVDDIDEKSSLEGRIIVNRKQLMWKPGCDPDMLDYYDVQELCEGNPVEVGRVYLIDTKRLRQKEFGRLAAFLTAGSSPYRSEYEQLKHYYNQLLQESMKPKPRSYKSLTG